MKSSTGYMTSSVLVGLLNREGGCCPNLINVLNLAKESGITVHDVALAMPQGRNMCCFLKRSLLIDRNFLLR